MSDTPLSGRRAQAAANDQRILEAAREVFVADPTAPIAAVAARAGVGISALYRRYPSKEALLQHLCGEGLARYIDLVEQALAADGDPWEAFATFLRRLVDIDAQSLTQRLAGTFTPTPELWRESARALELNRQLFERTKASGALRDDLEVNDISLLMDQLGSVRVTDAERTRQLRHRYLVLLLDALRATDATPLPGPVPTSQDISERWDTQYATTQKQPG